MTEHHPTIHRHPYFSTPFIYWVTCSCGRYPTRVNKFADDMGAWSAWWDHTQAVQNRTPSARCAATISRHFHPDAPGGVVYQVHCWCRAFASKKLGDDLAAWRSWLRHIGVTASLTETCGKDPYRSQETATQALLEIWRTYPNDPIRREIRTYECTECFPIRWHLTSRPNRSATKEVDL